jgi:polysaccharide export outer membrane protein
MLPRAIVMLTLTLALLGGCATARPHYDYGSEPDPRHAEYVLGPSDVLRITVWKNPDLSTEATVRPDGTISLPLVGDLRASGRTPAQLRAEIVQRLGTYLKDDSAVVTVAVTGINSYRFLVTGNVERPGAYSANHFVTASEALALAGGPNRFADVDGTLIIRLDATGKVRRIPIDYAAIMSGMRPEQDLPLLPGDRVYVP